MGAAWLHDPTDLAPRLCLLQVPEPRTAKNRLHVDLRVSGEGTPEEKWTRVTDEIARLSAVGAVALQEFVGHHVVMADPEGNEFLRRGSLTIGAGQAVVDVDPIELDPHGQQRITLGS